MQENDEDRDGFYETLIIYGRDKENTLEVFKRSRDGKIIPATKEELYKKQFILKTINKTFEIMSDSHEKMLDGTRDIEELNIKDVINEAVKKIIEEEKQKNSN